MREILLLAAQCIFVNRTSNKKHECDIEGRAYLHHRKTNKIVKLVIITIILPKFCYRKHCISVFIVESPGSRLNKKDAALRKRKRGGCKHRNSRNTTQPRLPTPFRGHTNDDDSAVPQSDLATRSPVDRSDRERVFPVKFPTAIQVTKKKKPHFWGVPNPRVPPRDRSIVVVVVVGNSLLSRSANGTGEKRTRNFV
jgi:hypothetical protein